MISLLSEKFNFSRLCWWSKAKTEAMMDKKKERIEIAIYTVFHFKCLAKKCIRI